MSFVEQLLKYNTVSIAGLEKNSGKTTCLNYIIDKLYFDYNKKIAITSIGLDGESVDQVTTTAKPEINLHKGMIFVTSEKFYLQKMLDAKIHNVSNQRSSMGRMVTAEAMSDGKCIIAGPDKTSWVKEIIQQIKSINNINTDVILIDGAISRSFHASPAIAEAIVLCTGAVISPHINTIVSKTKHWVNIVNIPQWEHDLPEYDTESSNTWIFDNEKNSWKNLKIESLMLIDKINHSELDKSDTIFTNGAITDKILETIITRKKGKFKLIVADFTKVFLSNKTLNSFLRNNNEIYVANKTKLVAICCNPYSPKGFTLNSEELVSALSKQINYPIIDVKQEQWN
ncbi:MAG: hypothetical protein WBH98_07725 [Bacteroidales bacterium]